MRKHTILALILGVVIFVLGGCIPAYSGNPSGETVGLWGDSTLGVSQEEIQAQLQPKYQTSLTAQPGWTVAALQDFAQEYADSNPNNVVISAGINDVFYNGGATWDGFAEFMQIGSTVAKYKSTTCVIWVNLYDSNGYWGEPHPDHIHGFNAALNYWKGVYSNMRIMDWNSAVYFFGAENVLTYDHVHANQNGQNLFAYLVDNALTGCP